MASTTRTAAGSPAPPAGDSQTADGGRYSAPLPSGPGLRARFRFELAVAARMTADNFPAAIVPSLAFTGAACIHFRVGGPTTLLRLATSLLWFTLFIYLFDASNQAGGAAEDALNKPYRPIPAGMITPRGSMLRFWSVMPLFTLLAWATGTLALALLWQTLTVALHLLSTPRIYLVVKPAAMQLAVLIQLAAAWTLVAPLDAVGWRWVLVTGVGYNAAMVFEDVRDMDGDREIGRRTLALTVGHWPVRIWFATVLIGLPFLLYFLLFAPSSAGALTISSCALLVTAMNWTAAARSLLRRSVRADRITYQLYALAFGATLACGLVLL